MTCFSFKSPNPISIKQRKSGKATFICKFEEIDGTIMN